LDTLFHEFAVRDVAKIPDSAAILLSGVDERRRVSVEHFSILELDLIPALFVPMVIEILDPLNESVRIRDSVG
jgi:hypothetical protein